MNNPTETAQGKRTQRWNLVFCVISAVIIVGGFAAYLNMGSSDENEKNKKSEKIDFTDVTIHAGSGTVLVEKVQNQVDENRKSVEEIKKNALDQSALLARMKTLEETVSDLRGQLAAGVPAEITTREGEQNAGAVPQDTSLREDRLTLAPQKTPSLPAKNPDVYVPAGTFAEAIMVGGADASAAVNAQSNPVPMLFRIVADGTLPNHRKSHLKDCVLTAAVVGDISSERGQIRTEHLSCVFPDGRVLDVPVEGTIFGPGGRNGVRGTPVWREGALLQRAFAAGTLSGLSEGLSQTYTTNSISAEGAVQTVNPGRIFQYGGAKGVGKAMDKLADYNIQRAEQYHPVIQISAGTVVDVVFLKGFFLDGRAHDDRDEKDEKDEKADSSRSPFDAPLNREAKTLPFSSVQISKLQEGRHA